jgi:Sulfotransferase family
MIYVNNELKALYFHIPKCGGSNIKKLLIDKYGFIGIPEKYDRTKRPDHQREFTVDDHTLDLPNLSVTSIRKKGVLRYFIDNKTTNELLGLDDEKWSTYFKFTFIRDPYKKFLSAFHYLKLLHNTVPAHCEEYCYANLRSFFDFRTMINNLGYFHSYITQNDHLLDNKLQINVNFLGNIDNYKNDMVAIFKIIGLKNAETNNMDKNGKPFIHNLNIDYEKDTFYQSYNQETIELVNEAVAVDFDLLGFQKFSSYDDFVGHYSRQLIEESSIVYEDPLVCPVCNLFKAYNKTAYDAHCFHCK